MRISHRPKISLEGLWNFKLDPMDMGEKQGWYDGLPEPERIYVPASWNGQNPNWNDYMGVAWYERKFSVPREFEGTIPWLTFEGISYRAKVWLNGIYLGDHEGSFTAFRLNAKEAIRFEEENTLVVRVDNRLSPQVIPPGEAMNRTYFDFFHYGGIQRPTYIEFTGTTYISDLTVNTSHKGHLKVKIEIGGEIKGHTVIELLSPGGTKLFERKIKIESEDICVEAEIKDITPWSPESPVLYTLRLRVFSEGGLMDWIDERIGFRSVEVREGKLFLNGRPVYLKGFGRHEDFPITGKYVPGPVLVRDFNLMKEMGANSFRTSHYPYSRLHLDLADEYGFLVILEAPLVGLREVHFTDEEYLRKAKQMISEMIKEHKNRPSVIMYSVANEPHSSMEAARDFIKELYDHVRKLDPTRPITFASMFHTRDKAIGVVDVISVNMYFGWYLHHGDIERGVKEAENVLDELHNMYPEKPILVTEFGAGAINGLHTDPPAMWSEEYQAEFLKRYIDMFKRKEYLIGFHIWCFADFKTPQSHFRTVLNRKGVYTWIREPKLAARVVKEEYSKIPTFRD